MYKPGTSLGNVFFLHYLLLLNNCITKGILATRDALAPEKWLPRPLQMLVVQT